MISLINENKYTLDDYKNKGYDDTRLWLSAMNDPSFQNAFQSNNNKTIWLGKGLGGGTLHFGLQYIDNISKNYEEWSTNNYFTDLSNITNAKKYNYSENIPSEGVKKQRSSMLIMSVNGGFSTMIRKRGHQRAR